MKNKKKMNKELRIKIQEDLYEAFQRKCEQQYTTVSSVMRDMIVCWVGGNSNG